MLIHIVKKHFGNGFKISPYLKTGFRDAAFILHEVGKLEEKGYAFDVSNMRWSVGFPDGRYIVGEQDERADRIALLSRALDCVERCERILKVTDRPDAQTDILAVHLASGMIGEIVEYSHPWITLRVNPFAGTNEYPDWFYEEIKKRGLQSFRDQYDLSLCVEPGRETAIPLVEGEDYPKINWEEALMVLQKTSYIHGHVMGGQKYTIPDANWF